MRATVQINRLRMRKTKPLSPLEFVLICTIIGVVLPAGMQIVFSRFVSRSSAAAQVFYG
jgi:hypothetical protein